MDNNKEDNIKIENNSNNIDNIQPIMNPIMSKQSYIKLLRKLIEEENEEDIDIILES